MREVICLRAISDFSYREIGQLLGKSENWARVSFYRGKECQSIYEYLKYTELCINATEKKEINGLKKLERYISGKILMNYLLFLTAIVLGILILLFTTNRASYDVYFLLMPLTMLATGFTFQNHPFQSAVTKVFHFGIVPHNLGPLMSAQFKITILISLIFVIFYLYQVGNKKIRYSLWCNTSILCIFLNLTYDSTLYRMESFDTITTTLFRNTVILFAAALIASFLLWLQGKFRKK